MLLSKILASFFYEKRRNAGNPKAKTFSFLTQSSNQFQHEIFLSEHPLNKGMQLRVTD